MSDAALLPANATAWERSNSLVSTRILGAPVALILKERDPARCDAQFVAPLAWERSVHFWSPGDDAGNRARVASSFVDHLQYGAPAPLEAEIGLDTGYQIALHEFWQLPGLVWPDFVVDVVINPGDPTPVLSGVYASALTRKPPRDVLDRVRIFALQPAAPLEIGAGCCVSSHVVVLPFNAAPPPPQIAFGAATRVMPIMKILPLRAA
jgi:phage tail P2-like protein